ncbi:hypothetical protein ES703_70202 [subsurface metagenome]
MDRLKYLGCSADLFSYNISVEIHFEYYVNDNHVSDWYNFEPDEIIDMIDHETDLREYELRYIIENPRKNFLFDFLIENLNKKIHEIITIDFEDIIIKRKEEG